jgi:hypothetical protein
VIRPATRRALVFQVEVLCNQDFAGTSQRCSLKIKNLAGQRRQRSDAKLPAMKILRKN